MEYFYAIEPLSPSARISIQAKVGTPIKDKRFILVFILAILNLKEA